MKLIKGITVAVAIAGLCVGTVSTASASIDLSSNGVGWISPTVIPPSGLDVSYLNNMIDVYNGDVLSPIGSYNYNVKQGTETPDPDLAKAAALLSHITPSKADGYGQPTATLHLGTGSYTYLIAQWDGPNGANAVYYISGVSGDIILQNDLPVVGGTDLSKFGLSGYWLAQTTDDLTKVPEPTTIIAGALLLLPFGASTIRILRRK